MKSDVIIIGAGLVGSMTARYLNKKGYSTTIIDREDVYAASKCSFGVFKDGWVNENIRDFVDEGVSFLEKVCGKVEEIPFFDMKREIESPMKYVDCNKILMTEYIKGDVDKVKDNKVWLGDGTKFVAKKAVVIAAGAFTDKLLVRSNYGSIRNIDSYWGATLDVNLKIDENRIMEWAPYKQCVLVRNGKGFVFGDGASVKNPKSADPRIEKVSIRLIQHLNDTVGSNVNNDNITSLKEGLRPYLPKGQYEYAVKHDDRLISVTGGAKNTTILCAHMAKQVYKLIKQS